MQCARGQSDLLWLSLTINPATTTKALERFFLFRGMGLSDGRYTLVQAEHVLLFASIVPGDQHSVRDVASPEDFCMGRAMHGYLQINVPASAPEYICHLTNPSSGMEKTSQSFMGRGRIDR